MPLPSNEDNRDSPQGWSRKPLVQIPPEVGDLLDDLSEDQQEAVKDAIRGWLDPVQRFESMRREVDEGEPPAYYVPSAEGISVYQGMFGPNGELDAPSKERLRRMLTEIVNGESPGEKGSASAQGPTPDADPDQS